MVKWEKTEQVSCSFFGHEAHGECHERNMGDVADEETMVNAMLLWRMPQALERHSLTFYMLRCSFSPLLAIFALFSHVSTPTWKILATKIKYQYNTT